MAPDTAARRRFPAPLIAIAVLVLVVLVAFVVYISLPNRKTQAAGPSSEATAYLSHLALSDVKMQAAENFMNQQVVEVAGKITNHGSRTISRLEVTCLFHDMSGRVIYQQRVPVVEGGNFLPGQTRSFRLPFDTLPSDWNQAMPNLVIAQITFEG